ncbi:hypothetical protein HGRIS_000656 [Hohenbuehelia grisea]|uniref:Uncharacterized protein n=1 Tax=Hohenbuehelia grisea TaxID=104357 RepID=A0ABR3JRT8_9AGAR
MAPSTTAADLTTSDPIMEFMPEHGDYVVFYIDFIASVMFLEDEEAFAAARELAKSTCKYVGFVDGLCGIPRPIRLGNPCDVNLLFHGLPTIDHLGNDKLCASPALSFPVFPNEVHPLSRMAVKPEPPLPWKDCYHSSFGDAQCRLSSNGKDRIQVTTLDKSFRRMLRRECTRDLESAEELYVAAAVPLPPTPISPSASLPAGDLPQCFPNAPASAPAPPSDENAFFDFEASESIRFDPQYPRYCGSEYLSDGDNVSIIASDDDCAISDEDDEEDNLLASFLKATCTGSSNPMYPIIQVDLDLSTIDDFDPPSEYFKEEAALRSIIRAGLVRQYRREIAVDFGTSQASLTASRLSSVSESVKTLSSASSHPHVGHPSLLSFLKKLLRPLKTARMHVSSKVRTLTARLRRRS